MDGSAGRLWVRTWIGGMDGGPPEAMAVSSWQLCVCAVRPGR